MALRACAFLATSLDGFIARANGDIEWLNEFSAKLPEGEDCGYGMFCADVDAMVIGRRTFEKVLEFGDWIYGQKRVIVLSQSLEQLPEHLGVSVQLNRLNPADLCQSLSREGIRKIYVDGGETVRRFIAEQSLDEMTITRIPILLGTGIPLFDSEQYDILLQHVETHVFEPGLVQSVYRFSYPSRGDREVIG